MSRTLAVARRELGEAMRSRMFIVGTLFGPIFILGLFTLEALMFRSGGGEKVLTIVDAGTAAVGQSVANVLQRPTGENDSDRTHFVVSVVTVSAADSAAVRRQLEARTDRKEIDGFLWLGAGVLQDEPARYVGRSATNRMVMAQLEGAVQTAVQSMRLADQGIDPGRLSVALRPVKFETAKSGAGSARGSGQALFLLGYALGFVVYLVVIIFGAAVMRGVLEEKKDRIVEVIVSSMRAEELMLGKVLGIGGASVLQVAVWTAFAALALKYGGQVLAGFGMTGVHMPQVPGSVGAVFLLYFAGGFFLYAALYAALGAMAASDQDMQQLQFPVILILMLSYMIMFRAMADPEGGIARAASWIPFSSPMVMPIRTALTHVSLLEVAGSLGTLLAGGLLFVWLGGKIYRVGILATGKRPTFPELVRWFRAA